TNDRREAENDDEELAGIGSAASEGDHARLVIVAVDPVEALRIEINVVEGRLVAVDSVQIANETLKAAVQRLVHQVPVERVAMIPLAPLAEFSAHEQEFLARVRIHEQIQRA